MSPGFLSDGGIWNNRCTQYCAAMPEYRLHLSPDPVKNDLPLYVFGFGLFTVLGNLSQTTFRSLKGWSSLRGTFSTYRGKLRNSAGRHHVMLDGMHTRTLSEAGSGHTVDTGAVGYLLSLTERMREGLQIAFEDCWKVIYVIAMLRAINGRGGRFSKIEEQYKSSFLSVLWPNLTLDKDALTGFLAAVGLDRASMIKYMNYMRDEDEQIAILDGHKIICSSKGIKTAVLGHDTKKRYKTQINAIYFFSKSDGTIGIPTYYERSQVAPMT